MKVLGHPVHQMLIVFPVGLLVMAFIFDVIAMSTGGTEWSHVSYFLIPAGVIGGLIAAVFGFLDWRAVPSGSRASRIGVWHGIGNVVVVALFAISWWMRGGPTVQPSGAALTFSVLGTALLLVTGWLGGELVVRLGVGVDEGANANAPSSLETDRISSRASRQDADRLRRPIRAIGTLLAAAFRLNDRGACVAVGAQIHTP